MARVRMIKCPECADEFELEDYLETGDTTVCPSCDAELKIIRLDPPRVEVMNSLAEEEKDYDEEDAADSEEF
ncbi:MAG: lysine biosynthesis protein LysW [Candidatus Omnitrophota bacterium]|nr:lysine biosynthesis protein LysW [Candidatus Omnitrophota bacterium]